MTARAEGAEGVRLPFEIPDAAVFAGHDVLRKIHDGPFGGSPSVGHALDVFMAMWAEIATPPAAPAAPAAGVPDVVHALRDMYDRARFQQAMTGPDKWVHDWLRRAKTALNAYYTQHNIDPDSDPAPSPPVQPAGDTRPAPG